MSKLKICPACKGLGIIPVGKKGRICPVCKGNAKVPADKFDDMLDKLADAVKESFVKERTEGIGGSEAAIPLDGTLYLTKAGRSKLRKALKDKDKL